MKLQKTLVVMLLAAAMGVGAVWMQQDAPMIASCQTTVKLGFDQTEVRTLQCNEVEQPSWRSWVTGKSRSTQFHFIDLVELLSRLQSKPE